MLSEKQCKARERQHRDSGNEPLNMTENTVCLKYGNTVIRVIEHFPKEGKSVTDLLENTIRYEGRKTENSQSS